MNYQPKSIVNAPRALPKLPAWVTSASAETLESVAFKSGVMMTMLDALVSDPAHGVPVKLLGNRLSLKAAMATSKLEGRLAREADIRDAYHLTPVGEARGPDGDLLAFWRDAVRLRLTGGDWHLALGNLVGSNLTPDIEGWLKSAVFRSQTLGPLSGCISVMGSVLEVDDRAERAACLLSDVVLARSLNWPTVLPVSSLRVTKAMLRDLVGEGQRADLVIQQCILRTLEDTVRIARDLAKRGAALRKVAPKLRAKGSDAAVSLFLSEDAIAPSITLSPRIQGTNLPMTDRAARRFCDRLVELGVAHELTGRPTFRLYGIAP